MWTLAAGAMLALERWRRRWTPAERGEFPRAAESPVELPKLPRSTHSERPFGTAEFVARREQSTLRPLKCSKSRKKEEVAPRCLANQRCMVT